MPNFASVTLIGHIGQDPESKTTPSGDAVTSFSLATTEKRKDGDITTWWRCALFGKRAEVIQKYCRKGDPLQVQGRPMLRPWTDRDGALRQSLEVSVSDFTLLGSKRDAGPSDAPAAYANTSAGGERRQASRAATAPAQAGLDDDIPF